VTDLREHLAGLGIALGDVIGRGATAVVYRATDRRHSRPVAVKVFQPAPGGAVGADWFLREIRMAAGLQHPHVLPVYDSGAAGDALFYVMPYVEGESLRDRLTREGRLPLQQALRIAREVADALGFAHAHGVVHRDIKPENILLESGHAVVTDFGVALAVGRTPLDLTAGSMVVGSPAYMSPEQASGDPAVDGRTDIYGLGCVLYEMLAGQPPFQGISPRAIVARRFLGPPIPLHQRRSDVPTEVSDAVQKALAVDPAERFARVEDFAAALGQPASVPTVVSRRSRVRVRTLTAVAGVLGLAAITLLPGHTQARRPERLDPRRVAVATLSNETGDDRLAPLGSQVVAWITDRLSQVRAVEVVTSATTVPASHDERGARGDSDEPERLHALAEETGAGTLITGSYYRGADSAVEFHIEIVDANSGELLRAIGPVDGRGSSAGLADELSREVAGALDTLLPRVPASPATVHPRVLGSARVQGTRPVAR
jgi:eukaryotic-like serine/threonine-protein kinase